MLIKSQGGHCNVDKNLREDIAFLREDIAEQLEWIVDHMTLLITYTSLYILDHFVDVYVKNDQEYQKKKNFPKLCV